MVFIYGLFDPTTNELRYVGKTNNLRLRLNGHMSSQNKESSHKRNWIKGLLNKGYSPEIFVLDEVSDEDWPFWEQWHIQYWRGIGCNLTNHPSCPGGENPPNPKNRIVKESSKNKISQYASNRPPEVIEKLRKAQTGKSYTFESRVNMSKHSASRKITDSQVYEIKDLFNNGHSLSEIGRRFNVTRKCISKIVKNQLTYVGLLNQPQTL